MKKVISVILGVCMMISFSGCFADVQPSSKSHTTTAKIMTTTTFFKTTTTKSTTVQTTTKEKVSKPTTTTVKKVVTKATTPKTTAQETISETVYITPTGKRYHLDPNCGGKNSRAATLNTAIQIGLTPCKKCAQ